MRLKETLRVNGVPHGWVGKTYMGARQRRTAQLVSVGWNENLKEGERHPLVAFPAAVSSWLLPYEYRKELSAVSNEGRFVPESTGKANSFAEAIQP